MSFDQFISANGPLFLTVFGLLSLTSFCIIVWRMWLNHTAAVDLPLFLKKLDDQLQIGGTESALQMCELEQGMAPKLFAAALQVYPQGKVATRNTLVNLIELEMIPRLNFLLPLVLVFIKIAPMVGLLGTVWGMIQAFGKIAGATKVNPSDLANDIGLALFTTAEGLLIAIPLLFIYTLLRERVNKFEIELQRAVQAVLVRLPVFMRYPPPALRETQP